MLVLSRKVGEQIRISGDIVVVVKEIQGDRIKIGIEAPKLVRVLRGELQGTPLTSTLTPNPKKVRE